MKNRKNYSNPIEELADLAVLGISELMKLLVKLIAEILTYLLTNFKNDCKKIEFKSLRYKKTTNSQEALGISSSRKKEIKYNEIDFTKHAVISGASGSGKTILLSGLQERMMLLEHPIIFFDPKGDSESRLKFQELCRKHNRKCYLFTENYHAEKFNPFKDGTRTQVADRIMDAFQWSEQYYRDMCSLAINEVLKVLGKDNRPFTLSNILEVYEQQFLNDKNHGLYVKLKAINESDFGENFCKGDDENSLTIKDVWEQGACLYIGLSTQGYGETAQAVGKIFLGELLYNSYFALTNLNRKDLPPISVFFDEFGSIVTPRFIELQNKCRAAGMQLFMAVQSLSDIDRVDPKLTEQIVENASSLFILKQRLDSSASFFSNAIGTYKTFKYTDQIDEDGNKGGQSRREVYEHLVHPDIIKNLQTGQCILLRHNPTRIDLINIRNIELDKNVDFLQMEKTLTAPREIQNKNIFGEGQW